MITSYFSVSLITAFLSLAVPFTTAAESSGANFFISLSQLIVREAGQTTRFVLCSVLFILASAISEIA